VVLHHLLEDGALRFSELRRRLPQAAARVLTRQLRELEADGLISRAVFAEVPARVEYAPTALGRSLVPVIAALRDWGTTWLNSRPTRVATSDQPSDQRPPSASALA
jgi:DNA-binding HxlR family transcriptional regulator